jgi:hypothetical protein
LKELGLKVKRKSAGLHMADLPANHSVQTFRLLNIEVQAGRSLKGDCADLAQVQGYKFKPCL